MPKVAIIFGAGPAGLTAAYELLTRTDIIPVVLEQSCDIGGLCKTVNVRGNRIDIGGHRFFSKSDRVMNWWLNILPVEADSAQNITLQYQKQTRSLDVHTPTDGNSEKVMMVRNRLSRIYHGGIFFYYPLTLSLSTMRKLGFVKLAKIGFSYINSRLFPRKKETTLEDFYINRFGKELYNTFFKDYTEKVWGISCVDIPSDWGAQRIKELSIGKAIKNMLQQAFSSKKDNSISQKDKETSLIERFLYPRLGPGQLWEEVARQVEEKGGKILFSRQVKTIVHNGSAITKVTALNYETGKEEEFEGDYFFSSMPVKELIAGLSPAAPAAVKSVAEGLQYRDFITVGVLLKQLKVKNGKQGADDLIKDTWIYVQDNSVKMGRIQVFNNWSPYMVKDPATVWLGLEYFLNKGDALWSMSDEQFIQFAIAELAKINFIDTADVLDATILRTEKAYPAYFGSYKNFDTIRNYTDVFSNLYMVGRNGMHKYNNSDHSMLTAMVAVDNITGGIQSKDNIWAINTEQEYHESR